MHKITLAIALTLALLPSTAEAGPGAGDVTPVTAACSARALSAGDCDIVAVVPPVQYGPAASWLVYPFMIPLRSGGLVEPFQRGVTGAGMETLRFDTRDFGRELDDLCPRATCEVSFTYTSGASSSVLQIRVGRDLEGTTQYRVRTIDPNVADPTWVPAQTYAVYWYDPTTSARRMTSLVTVEGEETPWLTPNARGAFFGSQQPGWRVLR